VVISDFNVVSVSVTPDEAHAKLVINPDRVLSLSIPEQRLQAVAWRNSKIIQLSSCVQHLQFSSSHGSEVHHVKDY
jgi:hypothetical protein